MSGGDSSSFGYLAVAKRNSGIQSQASAGPLAMAELRRRTSQTSMLQGIQGIIWRVTRFGDSTHESEYASGMYFVNEK